MRACMIVSVSASVIYSNYYFKKVNNRARRDETHKWKTYLVRFLVLKFC